MTWPGSRPGKESPVSFTYQIDSRPAVNRLYLRLDGVMTDDDAKAVADKIIDEIQKLKPGFAVINDIRRLRPSSQTAAEHMRRAQEASVRHGHGRIIRIVGEQAITQMQWNRTLKSRAETAKTLEEAERMLARGN